MRQTVLTYGLRAGAILSLLMVLTIGGAKLAGKEFDGVLGMAVGYTTMVLSFSLVHFGVRTYRDTVLGGTVRFWPAFRAGLAIALIASACYALTWQVLYRTLLPDYAEKYGEQAVKQAEAGGKTPAEVAEIRAEMADFARNYRNPAYNFAMTILEPLPVGLLVSLISAGVLSRRRKAPLGALGGAGA